MVLSDKFGTPPRGGLVKRTVLYVLGFGLGSLAVAGVLSLILTTIADSVMTPKSTAAAGSALPPGVVPNIIGAPSPEGDKAKSNLGPKPASKARRPRANEATGAADDGSEQPL